MIASTCMIDHPTGSHIADTRTVTNDYLDKWQNYCTWFPDIRRALDVLSTKQQNTRHFQLHCVSKKVPTF